MLLLASNLGLNFFRRQPASHPQLPYGRHANHTVQEEEAVCVRDADVPGSGWAQIALTQDQPSVLVPGPRAWTVLACFNLFLVTSLNIGTHEMMLL